MEMEKYRYHDPDFLYLSVVLDSKDDFKYSVIRVLNYSIVLSFKDFEELSLGVIPFSADFEKIVQLTTRLNS